MIGWLWKVKRPEGHARSSRKEDPIEIKDNSRHGDQPNVAEFGNSESFADMRPEHASSSFTARSLPS